MPGRCSVDAPGASGWLADGRRAAPGPPADLAALRPRAGPTADMSSEAIDYVKKPAVDFIKDSWRLVKRCTKPDRNGAPLSVRCTATLARSVCEGRSL